MSSSTFDVMPNRSLSLLSFPSNCHTTKLYNSNNFIVSLSPTNSNGAMNNINCSTVLLLLSRLDSFVPLLYYAAVDINCSLDSGHVDLSYCLRRNSLWDYLFLLLPFIRVIFILSIANSSPTGFI